MNPLHFLRTSKMLELRVLCIQELCFRIHWPGGGGSYVNPAGVPQHAEESWK